MTDDDKELVRGLRIDADQCFTKCDPTKKWCKCAFYTRIADRIEALSAENERLREQLSGISGRLNVMREALIHTAGICNPASGFLKNATGVRKKHIENVCDIALAALGDTK